MGKEVLENRLPTPSEYVRLRKYAGWGNINEKTAKKSLKHSVFSISILDNGELVGFGRIVGDGVLFFYVSDVIVHPTAMGKGYGNIIMDGIRTYLKENALPQSSIGLLAAPNKEEFYKKYGFTKCPNEIFGSGMSYLEIIGKKW
ncbi:GNAT family N-acetyltransferase [Croceitalea marina]|uniref:GNAT family N-acetyltransferase n=1 Tax=Croceitalea marina TaxID=1775166 RepID=A0ABW5MRU6_9FLAO